MFALGITPLAVEAQLQFTFSYPSQGGNAFNQGPQGAIIKTALEAAAANFATAFSHMNYKKTIEIEASGYSTNNGTLMSAGTYFVSGNSGFGKAEATRSKILGLGDLTTGSTTAEGVLNVNFFHSWEFDYNTTPSASEFDWYGVLYHEFSHMVGFASGIATNGSGTDAADLFGNTTNGNWAAFDGFLVDSTGASVFDPLNPNNLLTETYESLLDGGSSPSNGLFFKTNTDTLVGLYSPTSFAGGSSGSHLDIDDTGSAYDNMMMLPSVGTGLATRTYSDIELEILRTIGYAHIQQISVVPEPKHVILGLGGVALLVVIIHRRFRKEETL